MILITGASGFIGKKLLKLVRAEYKNEPIFLLNKKKCDLVTAKGLAEIPKNPRIIFHLAAETDTSKPDQRCNDIGTQNLLNRLKDVGPKTHFIYTSSQAIFSGRTDTDKPINKDTKPAVNNRYGKTKLKGEKILLQASYRKKFKLTIVRLPTTWGKNPRSNSFLNFLNALVKSNSLFSKLNWPGKIGLIYVDDAAAFILKTASTFPIKPKIISIAAENLTLAQIFEKLKIANGKKYRQVKLRVFIWNFAKSLRPFMKYFEPIVPAIFYNYLWRASIVVDSPLWCKENIKGKKF